MIARFKTGEVLLTTGILQIVLKFLSTIVADDTALSQ
jgi:hypothetical protein